MIQIPQIVGLFISIEGQYCLCASFLNPVSLRAHNFRSCNYSTFFCASFIFFRETVRLLLSKLVGNIVLVVSSRILHLRRRPWRKPVVVAAVFSIVSLCFFTSVLSSLFCAKFCSYRRSLFAGEFVVGCNAVAE